ncbi:MAG: glycosyltransferase family 2 protein [Flavobacteriia bacterium]|nr:glycosyltransferase family 2 protein [Flavobacteriia bacterium]
MKIGVLIPMYNAEKTIEETLRSVLAQSELPYEICIVDDGSTDNSDAIVRKYAHEDNSILWKIVQMPNKGLGAARNAGLEVMTSDYVAFLDSDDCWTADKLRHTREFLERYPDTDILYHPIWEWKPESGVMRKRRDMPLLHSSDIWLHNPITPSATVVKIGGTKWKFDTDRAIHGVEDALLWTKALSDGLKIRRMNYVDTMYRMNHGMTKNFQEHEEHVQNALNKALKEGWIETEVVDKMASARAYHLARNLHKTKEYKAAVAAYAKSHGGLKSALLSLAARFRIVL